MIFNIPGEKEEFVTLCFSVGLAHQCRDATAKLRTVFVLFTEVLVGLLVF